MLSNKKTMVNLIEILTKQTKSLKIQYIEMTKEWAIEEFAILRQWAKDYQTGKFRFGEASKKYNRLPYYIVNPNGKESDHVEKMVKQANKHYNSSIEKLTKRIEKKQLDLDNLRVETAHIGVNIETILTDGNKTVRAFTIIAGGEIQRPHYRYLIK